MLFISCPVRAFHDAYCWRLFECVKSMFLPNELCNTIFWVLSCFIFHLNQKHVQSITLDVTCLNIKSVSYWLVSLKFIKVASFLSISNMFKLCLRVGQLFLCWMHKMVSKASIFVLSMLNQMPFVTSSWLHALLFLNMWELLLVFIASMSP